MRTLGTVSLLFLALGVAATASCTAATNNTTFGHGGHGNSSGSGNGDTGNGNSGAGGDTGVTFNPTGSSSSGGSTGMGCAVADMNQDMDKDGWTPAQGDCNDCDPNVNPGAIDVVPTADADGGVGPEVDSDCNGTFDPPQPCDQGLALDDQSGVSGAKAVDLCRFTSESPSDPKQKTWGVINAAYVHANGSAFNKPGLQIGLQPSFGTNVHTQSGGSMLMISSGHARTPNQSGACGSVMCTATSNPTPPNGFPQDNKNCPPSSEIDDDIGLDLKIRAPTNATGYSFSFKFYSFEFPEWVCNEFNDQFIALVNPAPTGSLNGNISFDSMHNPVSVNLGFFDVCDPKDQSEYTGPSLPNPYCPKGTSELIGTGFDIWDIGYKNSISAGATSWLQSQAPIQGGAEFSIRFAMWDTGDQDYDSSTLIDNFQWIATAGTVSVGTTPIETPK